MTVALVGVVGFLVIAGTLAACLMALSENVLGKRGAALACGLIVVGVGLLYLAAGLDDHWTPQQRCDGHYCWSVD